MSSSNARKKRKREEKAAKKRRRVQVALAKRIEREMIRVAGGGREIDTPKGPLTIRVETTAKASCGVTRGFRLAARAETTATADLTVERKP